MKHLPKTNPQDYKNNQNNTHSNTYTKNNPHPQIQSLKVHYYNTEETKAYLNLLTSHNYKINNQDLTKILITLENLREEGIASFENNDSKKDKIIIIPKENKNKQQEKNQDQKHFQQQSISIDEVEIVQTEGMI